MSYHSQIQDKYTDTETVLPFVGRISERTFVHAIAAALVGILCVLGGCSDDGTGGVGGTGGGGGECVATADADGDGVVDVADDFPADAMRTGIEDGVVVVLDPTETTAEVSQTVALSRADFYFLFDSTGSMGGELAALQSSMTSGSFIAGCPGGIVGAIGCLVSDALVGFGRFGDFPVSPYGGASCDAVFEHLLSLTDDPTALQASVDGLTVACGGSDIAESYSQALYHLFTGSGAPPYLDAAPPCTDGGSGYACFRPSTMPVVLLFTDAPTHEGPSGYPYDAATLGLTPIPWATTVATLGARGVTVISIESSGAGSTSAALADLNALAVATNSFDSDGSSLVVRLTSDGSGLGTAVIDAVSDIVNSDRGDVTLAAVDDPGTARDETALVRSVVPTAWGPGSCSRIAGNTLFGCLPGTEVQFSIDFDFDALTPSSTPTVIELQLELALDGFVQRIVPVRLVVPAALRACGDDDPDNNNGGTGGGTSFSGCGDIVGNCAPTVSCSSVTCPFDASMVDCTAACETLLAVCAGACPGVDCSPAIDMTSCMQTCGLETAFSCGNATFGCYTANDECASIGQCLGCSG